MFILTTYECRKCHHRWVPNKVDPKRCPKCQTYDWNPYPDLIERQKTLTQSETDALIWIAKHNRVTRDKVIKKTGSPDFFVTSNRKTYEVKQLVGRAVYISQIQFSSIMKSDPDCELVVFAKDDKNPVIVLPVSEIVSEKILDTEKYGQIYVKVS